MQKNSSVGTSQESGDDVFNLVITMMANPNPKHAISPGECIDILEEVLKQKGPEALLRVLSSDRVFRTLTGSEEPDQSAVFIALEDIAFLCEYVGKLKYHGAAGLEECKELADEAKRIHDELENDSDGKKPPVKKYMAEIESHMRSYVGELEKALK